MKKAVVIRLKKGNYRIFVWVVFRQELEASQIGISGHTDLLKALIANQDETVSKEHWRGMEGLVSEAVKHTIEDAPDKGPVSDAAIIA